MACDNDGGCGHQHAEPTDITEWWGRPLTTARGFCFSCVGRLALALDELPRLMAELAVMHLPDLSIRYRTDDITGGDPLHPPILLNEHADALSRSIDDEVTVWTELVAEQVGLDWDSALSAASRPGHRVHAGCQLLGYRVTEWLAMSHREYPARSLGHNPQDGHPDGAVHLDAGRWWIVRDGLDAAANLMDLHHRATRFTGGAPSDHIPIPCGYCSNRTLRRDHESGVVRCRTCGDTKTDDGYDQFLLAALAVHQQAAVAC